MEAKNLRRLDVLNHPNLVGYYGVRRDGDHLLMVLELLEGQDLSCKLVELRERGERVTESEAVDWIRQAAEGVAVAHEPLEPTIERLVHRDLKPSNLFLTKDGVIKVLDFGIARAVEETSPQNRLTGTGTMLCTPAYTAPELCADQPVTPASDVYALGLCLYELLLGHHPFQPNPASNEPPKSDMAMVTAQITKIPEPIRSLRPDISAALGDIVARATDKDPQKRYINGRSLADALTKLGVTAPQTSFLNLRPKPVAAPKPVAIPQPVATPALQPPSSPSATVEPSPKRGNRRRVGILAALVAVASIVAVVIFYMVQAAPSETDSVASIPDAGDSKLAQVEHEQAIKDEVARRLQVEAEKVTAAEAVRQAEEEAKSKAAEAAKLAEEQAQKEDAAAKKTEVAKKKKCEKYHSLIGGKCVFQDIQQPGSSLYWRRCAQGQKWTGSRCKGGKIKRTWEKAKRSCPRGYRLPSKGQFEGILAGKKYKKMFPSDTDWYWSSSPNDGGNAWLAYFDGGRVYWHYIYYDHDVRCVR